MQQLNSSTVKLFIVFIFALLISIFLASNALAVIDWDTDVNAFIPLSDISESTGLIDLSGNGYDATTYGASLTIDKTAFEFDGINDYVNSGLVLASSPASFSHNLWFNSDDMPVSVDSRLLGIGNSTNDDLIIGLYLENTNSKLNFYSRDNSNANVVSLQGTTTLLANTDYMATFTYDGSTIKIYLNGVEEDSASYTFSNVASDTFTIGALERTSVIHNFGGKLSYVSSFNKGLSSTEISDLYGEGRNYNPYTPSLVLSNFSTVSTGSFSFDTSVSISNSYGIVNSITYNNTVINSEPFYFASSLTSYGSNSVSTTATCRITIDGVSVSETSRTIAPTTYGNIALVSPADNLSLGEHIINTECIRSGTPNSNLDFTINNSQLSQFLLYDANSNSTITHLTFNDATNIPLTTTDTNLGNFTFTTENTTNSTNTNFLITQGVVNYNYDVDSNITAYFIITETGETCGDYTRGGTAGSTGSVGASCLFSNLNSSTEYNIELHAYTSTGTGSLSDLTSNLYNLKLNNTAANITTLNKTLSASTLTEIATIDLSNHLGGEYNIFSEASIIVNSNITQDAYFYLSNSVNTSNFYRTVNERSGNIVIQNVFSESGTGIKDVKLYGYCPSGCEIVGGSLNAFITDSSTVSTGLFNITAYNSYNDTQLQVFNVTIGGSTQTTTNGYVEAIGQGSVNVVVEAENFFSNTTLHDTTTNFNASLVKYVEIRANEVLGSAITSFYVNTSTDSYNTTNGVAYIPISAANTSVSINSDTIAFQTDLLNQTQYYNFTVFTERSIRINIYNGTTNNLVTQLVTIDTISDNISFSNTTTDGTLYLTLLVPNNYELRFTSDGFNPRSYFINVAEDSTQEVNVYLTSNSSTDIVRIQVVNTANQVVEGAVVWLQKQVVNSSEQWFTVQQSETNFEGETSVFVEKGTNIFYRFAVLVDGEAKPISPSNNLFTGPTFFLPGIDEIVQLVVDLEEESTDFITPREDVTCTIDRGNNSINYTFLDSSSSIAGGRLIIKARYLNQSINFSLVNNTFLAGSFGTLSYDFTPINGSEYVWESYLVYDDREELCDSGTQLYPGEDIIDKNDGLLLAIFLLLMVAFLTISYGPLMSTIAAILSLGLLTFFNLISIEIGFITSFIALAVILFFKPRKEGR